MCEKKVVSVTAYIKKNKTKQNWVWGQLLLNLMTFPSHFVDVDIEYCV